MKNRAGEIGFVSDNHKALARKVFEEFAESRGIEAGTQERFDMDLYVQMFAGDFGSLTGARQRACEDNRRDFQSGQELRDGSDFLLSFVGQRTFVVGLIPIRPICFSVAK